MPITNNDTRINKLNINLFESLDNYQAAYSAGLVGSNDLSFISGSPSTIQYDWQELDTESFNYILNKPEIPTPTASDYKKLLMIDRGGNLMLDDTLSHIVPLPDWRLIFYCDCNNNCIDRVSGIDLFASIYTATTSQMNYAPLFDIDPVDNTRYCIKKRSGKCPIPIIIGNYNLTGTINDRFIITKTSSISQETPSTQKFLASETYGKHKVTFYWYCGSATTTTTGIIFDSTGLGNDNENSLNCGVSLIYVNNRVVVRSRNNSSTTSDISFGIRSDLKNKWYYVEFIFEYISSTNYKASFLMKDTTTDNVLNSGSFTLTHPMSSTRGQFNFLSDSYGYGAWAQNVMDRIKEVKVYRYY